MNTKHPHIKFTFKLEDKNSFLFLDVLAPSVCRKPTFNGVFTNFKRFVPTVYKFHLVYSSLHRCFNIASSDDKFPNEINALK